MEFDPSTAEPVTAVVEPEFDPVSASPVATLKSKPVNAEYHNEFSLNEEEFKGASPLGRLKLLLSHPWDKYVASVDQGFKGVDIPRVEGAKDNAPAQVGAAVTNTASGAVGGVLSAGGVASILSPGTAAYAIPRFIAGGAEHIVNAAKGALSGEDSLQETTEKGLGGILMLAGGAHAVKSGLRGSVAPKTPEQAIDLVRSEAEKTNDPNAKAALEAAAVKISDNAKQGVAFDPDTATPVAGPEAQRAGSEKLGIIEREMKNPDNELRYSVYPAQEGFRDGKPFIAQVDLIDAKTKTNTTSANSELLSELGHDVYTNADIPENIKPGNYTEAELTAAIDAAKAESAPPVVKDFQSAWEAQGKQAGSENQIVVENGRVYKRNYNAGLDQALPNHGTLEAFNENLAVHNEIFPETALKFEGMSETPAGPAPVVSQVEVKGVEATKPEIDAFMAAKGFEPYSNSAYVNKEAALRVGDLKGDNVIKDANGVLHVIDPVIKRIAPEVAEVGLGAASPKEFQPVEKFTTSLKESARDQERVARGEAPIEKEISKTLGESWEEGARIVDENQNAPDQLVAELKETPRSLNDSDVAVLLHRKVDVQNEFNRAARNVRENIGTPDSLAADRATMQRTLDELIDIDEVSAKSATQTGRGLNAMKLAASQDFELSTMMAKRQTAKGGAKLTPEEMAEVQRQHADIEEAQRALDQHEAQLELDEAVSTPAEAEAQITKLEGEVAKAEQSPKPAPKSPEEKRLDGFKKRTQKRIEELRARIEKGDFSKKPRREVHLDEEANRLQAKLDQAKADFNSALEREKFEQLSGIQKLRVKAVDVYDAARNLMTTGEFSFVLRQGKLAAAAHPVMAAKALPKAFQALFADEVTARAIDLQTLNHPDAAGAREAGLHLVEEGARLSAREEALASTLADKLPVLRNFNQAGRIFLNKLRFDLYETMKRPDFNLEQRKAVARYANEATGRGSLGSLERAAVPLARVLFAPRYLASRIQYAVGHSMWGGDLATRRIIAKEYARTLVGLGVYYTSLITAFNALNPDKDKKPVVTFDPRSTDFGKIKMGNTRLDPLAGLSQVIVFGARTASGEKTTNAGKVVPIRGKVPYGGQKWTDVATTFARSKLHPIPGSIVNLFNGTDLAGKEATLENQAANMVAPLSYIDIYQALEEQDLPEGVSLSLLALLGEGLQTYKNTKPKKQMGQPPAMLKK